MQQKEAKNEELTGKTNFTHIPEIYHSAHSTHQQRCMNYT